MHVSERAKREAIAFAAKLVRDHHPSMPARERLWQIAEQLNVKTIAPGAIRSQGFLKRIDNGSFAVYYSNSSDLTLACRRYTVAHELAHVVLERFVSHIDQGYTVTRRGGPSSGIEKAVDRIAAELLMPCHLVVRSLVDMCTAERKGRDRISKRRILTSMMDQLGVSESAFSFRLVEIPELLTVLIRVPVERRSSLGSTKSYYLEKSLDIKLVDDKPSVVMAVANERFKTDNHVVDIQTRYGVRGLRCQGWLRRIKYPDSVCHEYWIVGWSWNEREIPAYDDSLERS